MFSFRLPLRLSCFSFKSTNNRLVLFMHVDMPEPPPDKDRRSLAGSIVSTAFNAALIGTAVVYTVYRLCVPIHPSPRTEANPPSSWRDRGKGPERLPPPPPYDQGEWAPEAKTPSLKMAPALTSSPNRTKKAIHTVGSMSKRITMPVPRRSRARGHQSLPYASSAAAATLFPHPQPEFTFGGQEDGRSAGDVEARVRCTFVFLFR